MLNAIPKTYGCESVSGEWGNELITSSGVKALLNSCLYPSSARSCSSALAITSLVMVVDRDVEAGGGNSRDNVLLDKHTYCFSQNQMPS